MKWPIMQNCIPAANPGKLNCRITQGSHFTSLIYVNDMPQSVDCHMFLYADDTCVAIILRQLKLI